MSDLVDTVRRQWGDVDPELDTEPMAVVGRVLRLAALVRQLTADLLAEYKLNRPEFDALCAVRRNGELQPGQISKEMLSSGAAVTKRVARLESLGLVERAPGERDRRVIHVRITERGAELLAELLPRQLAAEGAVLDRLSTAERTRLATSLRTVLEAVEGPLGAAAGQRSAGTRVR